MGVKTSKDPFCFHFSVQQPLSFNFNTNAFIQGNELFYFFFLFPHVFVVFEFAVNFVITFFFSFLTLSRSFKGLVFFVCFFSPAYVQVFISSDSLYSTS